jgi:hypothetical protein
MPKLLEHIDTQYALYPRIEECYIDTIAPVGKDKVDVVIGGKEITHYELDFSNQAEQTISVGKHQHITLCYTPKSHYEMLGSSQNGVIVIKDTNVPFKHPLPIESWTPHYPASDMLRYNKFNGETPWEILCDIRSRLQEHLGTPSDEAAKDGPGKQFARALKGDYRLQCNNIVEIFVFACACKSHVARRINLWQGQGVWPAEAIKQFGAQLYTAQGHTTAEVFDYNANKWVWMDPMWGITSHKHCTLLELRGDLCRMIETYDGKGMLFNQHESYDAWKSYLNEHQRISYVYP